MGGQYRGIRYFDKDCIGALRPLYKLSVASNDEVIEILEKTLFSIVWSWISYCPDTIRSITENETEEASALYFSNTN